MASGSTPGKPTGSPETSVDGKQPVSGELDQRMSKLEAELVKKGLRKDPVQEGDRSETSASVAQAVKLSSEFIAGVVVGALIGWFIDRFAGTSPWGLIIFLLLGFLAGTLNVLRTAGYVAPKSDVSTTQKPPDKE